MTVIVWLLAILHIIMWIVLLGNVVYLRRKPVSDTQPLPSLSVLIPARDEAENLLRLLPSLTSQKYPDFEVVIYDDDSSDETASVIAQFTGDQRVRSLSGSGPPGGWVGKVYALYECARVAKGSVYLFLDADVHLMSDSALETLVRVLLASPRRSVLTVLPRLNGGGLLLVSLVPHALLTALPWYLLRRVRGRILGAVNGQAWMIRAADYHALEPHEKVKNEVLEDVNIGRYLLDNDLVPVMVDATQILSVRMYDNMRAAWRGFRKNAYLLMGNSVLSFLIFLILYAAAHWVSVLVSGYLFASALCLKVVSDRIGKIPITYSILSPLSFVLATLLQIDSAIAHWRQRVEWKGRIIST